MHSTPSTEVNMQTLAQIQAYREATLNADTLAELQSLADQIIGHHEGMEDDDARELLLEYLTEWRFDYVAAHAAEGV
jgi:hypothetical protein